MTTTTNDMSGPLGLNPETSAVINYMQGKRTAKQIVGEFFGLREEAVYDDNGENVLDFISDFKDMKALKQKKVQYNEKFAAMGVTKEAFNALFPHGLPTGDELIEKTQEEKLKETFSKMLGKDVGSLSLEEIKAKLEEEVDRRVEEKIEISTEVENTTDEVEEDEEEIVKETVETEDEVETGTETSEEETTETEKVPAEEPTKEVLVALHQKFFNRLPNEQIGYKTLKAKIDVELAKQAENGTDK